MRHIALILLSFYLNVSLAASGDIETKKEVYIGGTSITIKEAARLYEIYCTEELKDSKLCKVLKDSMLLASIEIIAASGNEENEENFRQLEDIADILK